jgi:hypothetical protein
MWSLWRYRGSCGRIWWRRPRRASRTLCCADLSFVELYWLFVIIADVVIVVLSVLLIRGVGVLHGAPCVGGLTDAVCVYLSSTMMACRTRTRQSMTNHDQARPTSGNNAHGPPHNRLRLLYRQVKSVQSRSEARHGISFACNPQYRFPCRVTLQASWRIR